MAYLIVFIYIISLLFIFLFSLSQLHLTWYYLKNKRNKTSPEIANPLAPDLPVVTVQLPVYNERYVVKRLIKAVAQLNYPKDKLEIQVLDDSSDETTGIISTEIERFKTTGLNIKHVQRTSRKGFKAGALKHGLETCMGEFIAIFDADFLPGTDFLLKTITQFKDKNIGLVQTRWGHINQDYSLLTRLQAFGLNAHFSIEQSGRSAAGSYINFNGTAGVWRKECIFDAGGWSADTLTEDLDLSYRAQIKQWKFSYLEDVVTPAELPVMMSAVKSQQYRWNKGAAETARKNLLKVLKSNVGMTHKAHSLFHLLNSSVFVYLLTAAIFSIPLLFMESIYPELDNLLLLGSIFLIGFFSIAFFYWVASKKSNPHNTWKYYLSNFPAFLVVTMGLSLHNALAVMEGFLGFKSPFIRTPKFNIVGKKDTWKNSVYVPSGVKLVTLTEGLLSLYFIFGIIAGIHLHNYGLLLFHLMLSLGFATVFTYSIKSAKYVS